MTAARERQGERRVFGSWIVRGLAYFAFWVLLIGIKPVDLVVGVAAAAAATWTSLNLLPPGTFRVRLAGLPRYVAHFLWQSVVAGFDVARRAFSPDLPLKPGLVHYASRHPRGAARNVFASLTCLLPGTLAVRDEPQGLLYHCLDTEQPMVEQLAEEEAAFCRAVPEEPPS